MLPDPKWLDALKLPLKATASGAVATTLLLALLAWKVIDTEALGRWVTPTIAVVAVVFWSFTVVGALEFLFAPMIEKRKQAALATRRAVRRREEQEGRDTKRAEALARLDHLSEEELRYVADCLRKGTPTFYTWAHSSAATMLIGKGLAWTSGGQHHGDRYPFSLYDFAWEALLKRREEFLEKEAKHREAEAARKAADLRRHRI